MLELLLALLKRETPLAVHLARHLHHPVVESPVDSTGVNRGRKLSLSRVVLTDRIHIHLLMKGLARLGQSRWQGGLADKVTTAVD